MTGETLRDKIKRLQLEMYDERNNPDYGEGDTSTEEDARFAAKIKAQDASDE